MSKRFTLFLLSRYIFDLSDLMAVESLIMLINVCRRRCWHFIFFIGVRKASMMMRVVMMMVDRTKVAVLSRVCLAQHV